MHIIKIIGINKLINTTARAIFFIFCINCFLCIWGCGNNINNSARKNSDRKNSEALFLDSDKISSPAQQEDRKEAVYTPITHLPFWRQEPELFGYSADVVSAPVCFDSANRQYTLNAGNVITVDKRQLLKLDFTGFIKKQYPNWDGLFRTGAFSETHIVFDADDHAYMLINACQSNIEKVLLLYSTDHCRTWQVYPICSGGENTFVNIEQRDGNSELKDPPAVIVGDHTWENAGMRLTLLKKNNDGSLEIDQPLTVAPDAYIIPIHSGGGNIVVSVQDKIHFFWADNKEIEGKENLGTPQYCRSYDRKTGQFSKIVFLGFGGKGKPDPHNLPAVSVDSKGFLHVLLGAHHDQFKYTKSLKANSVVDGWTVPEPIGIPKVGANGSYTYIGLVCDRNDTLHAIARWAGDQYFFRLVYMRKTADAKWEHHKVLVSPFKSRYSCWYQKMSVDRENRIFCSYIYFGAQLDDDQVASFSQKCPSLKNYWYQGNAGMRCSAIIMSDDSGDKWQLTNFNTINSEKPQLIKPIIPSFHNEKRNSSVSISGQFGGAVCLGQISGNRMILGIGSRLAVMDIANPADPQVINQSALVEGTIRCATTKNNYVYAGVDKRLIVFKLNDSFLPVAKTSLDLSTWAIKVGVYKNYLLASSENDLRIFDISNPEKPIQVEQWNKTQAYDFEIKDDKLYLAAGKNGIYIFDLKNPDKLNLIGSLPSQRGDNATSAYSVSLTGNYLLSGPAWSGVPVRVLDISNPSRPKEVSRFKSTVMGWGRKVVTKDKYAYYPAPDFIYILDISDPGNLKESAKIPVKGNLKNLVTCGDTLYAGMENYGMGVFNISAPLTPRKIAHYAEPLCPWGISAAGTLALLTDWKNGFYLCDISTPANPRISALLEKEEMPKNQQKKSMFRAAVKENHVFLATGQDGLWVIDIKEPKKMKILNKLKFDGGIRDIVISKNTAFLAEENQGVRIIDISDVNNIRTAGTIKFKQEILSLAIKDQFLFTGHSMRGGCGHISGYDVSNIEKPVFVFDFQTDNDVWGLDANDDFLYAAKADNGVEVIDISAISSPKYEETINVPGNVWDVCVTDKTIYFANGKSGLFFATKAKATNKEAVKNNSTVPDRIVTGDEIVREKSSVKPELLPFTSMGKGWENIKTIAVYDIKDRLLLPVQPGLAGKFNLSIGAIVGDEFPAYDVYLKKKSWEQSWRQQVKLR